MPESFDGPVFNNFIAETGLAPAVGKTGYFFDTAESRR